MRTKSLLACAMAAMACATALQAAIPPGYYDKANGLKRQELKTAMHMICGQAATLSYGSGEGRTWTGFYRTDRTEDNRVVDRYSNGTFYFKTTDSEYAAYAVTGMNIEHSFPKSWWGGTENQAYKDLFNLMPSEQKINSSKSNYPMGTVTNATTDNGCTRVGKGGNGYNLWEPADKWKGDFARSYFYMVTMYSHLPWSGAQATQILEDDEWPTLRQWAYDLYMQWAREDPVDDIERQRNEAVYAIQGNRNPFVDFPHLAEYVWGDSTDYAFKVPGAKTESDPAAYSGIVAFPATDVVNNIYNCYFTANWSKVQGAGSYMLDVYTKDSATGAHKSVSGYPASVSGTTAKVSDIEYGTAYYYTVRTSGGRTSNEMPVMTDGAEGMFSVSPMMARFSVVPGQASQAAMFTVSLTGTEENVVTVSVERPFELATEAGAAEWTQTLTLTGAATTFYVRLAPQDATGDYSGTLTVATAGEQDKRIPLTATVDRSKAFFEDFETGSKGAYASGTVRCSASEWQMNDALIGKDANANDTYSARIKGGGSITMTEDKAGGCDSLWFHAALYNKDTGVKLSVSYSTDGGATWTAIAKDMAVGTWQRYGFKIGTRQSVRLRIEAVGTASKRVNIDDIQMSDYGSSTGIAAAPQEGRAKGTAAYDLQGRWRAAPATRGKREILIMDGRKIAF